MLAFFLKILLCLLVAAAIGYLVAWLLRGLTLSRLREQNYRLTSDLSARDNQVLAAHSQVQDLRAKHASIEREVANFETRNKELQATISEQNQRNTQTAEELRLEQERHRTAIIAAAQRQKELEHTSTQLSQTVGQKESEISRLGLQLTPLLALPIALSARESENTAIKLKHDEAVAAQAMFERELVASRSALDMLRREKEEQLTRRSMHITELEDQAASDEARLADLEALTIRRATEAQALGADIKALQNKINAINAEKNAELTRLNTQVSSFAALPATLSEREAEVRSLQQKLNDATQAARVKDQELSATRARIESELSAARGKTDGEVSQLKSRLASISSEMQSRESTLSTLRVELDAARKTLESRSALLRDSESAKSAATNALKAKDAELSRMRAELSTLTILPGKISTIQSELDTERAKIKGLEAELLQISQAREAQNKRPPRQFATAPNQIDDLKHIYGVGPVLEKTLQGLGIYQFRQVALWNKDDVLFFDSQLHEFHGRIEREHWVRSAQEEHHKKYGEWLGDGLPTITMPETNR